MIADTCHIIQQQYLHVEVNGTESDGLTLQRRLPGLCEEGLIPAIEWALNRCAPTHGHLSIERLDIDTGILSLERLEHDLAESVGQALEKTLREHIPRGEQTPTLSSGNVQLKTARQSLHEAFIYFLTTGSLPWSFRLPAGKNLEEVILDSWHEAEKAGEALPSKNDAFSGVLGSEISRTRLIRQFSLAFLEGFLARISPEGKTVMDGIVQVLGRTTLNSEERQMFEKHLWGTAFALATSGKVLTVHSLVEEACLALPGTFSQQSILASMVVRHWPDAINTAPVKRIEIPERKPSNETGPARSTLPESQERPVIISHHDLDLLAVKEGLCIENAGLVLVHPFLPRFFEALGIAAEDTLHKPERALCLLHFLTTGQIIAPEYELLLPKILCNIPLLTPVESDIDLTDNEKEEAVALLEAVIRHWEGLRNTSPDGLRGTFLLRAGKVSLRDDGDWLLQVESNTFDILLEQLPWSISMIKLPWMHKMVWVEWG